MNIFESFGKKSVRDMSPIELEAKGLKGICMECLGKTRVGKTIFSEGKVCANCHGKGFLHEQTEDPIQKNGVLH